MTVQVIDRELYTVAEAARILRMPPSTLRWWLEGKRGHQPVIRLEATGSNAVTWGEFVEAGFLHEYRDAGVPLQRLRRFVTELRQEAGVPYPLAHAKPLVLGRGLVVEAQRIAGLDVDGHGPVIYEAAGGHYLFAAAVEQYVKRIDFAQRGYAERIYPAGRQSPVVIDPEFAFGAPSVNGIRTAVLTELLDAGEAPEEVAEDYGLNVRQVKAAAAYEWSDGTATAA
jgi:uncharacterized protein (DUF433 family)